MQAQKLGVNFEFGSTLKEEQAQIVSTGPKKADIIGFGAIYEDVAFDKDRFLMMYDDRYSPMGFYFYIIPTKNGIKALNCVSAPHGPKVKELFYRAIKERKEIRDIIGDAKPKEFISGIGNVALPRTAVRNGVLYTGEAAGFQDATYGFGMTTALESGKLAADSIIHNTNYDMLWKKQFQKWLEDHLAKRFVTSVMGDRIVERIFRKYDDGDVVDFFGLNPGGMKKKIAFNILLQLELLKHRITGYW